MLFRIKPGFTFRADDGSVKGAGEEIDLSDDSAVLHRDKVEVIEPAAGAEQARQDDQDA